MKTPKRHTGQPRAADLYAQRHSRWKRKNKITQYKRTITRLTQDLNLLRSAYTRPFPLEP